jgi:hypothetical protein
MLVLPGVRSPFPKSFQNKDSARFQSSLGEIKCTQQLLSQVLLRVLRSYILDLMMYVAILAKPQEFFQVPRLLISRVNFRLGR